MTGPGETTAAELRSAPAVVTSLLERLDAAAERTVSQLDGGVRFVGCGSSHLVGGLAASLLRGIGVDADAVVASEAADERWHPDRLVVAISRSGRTTETLEAVACARAHSTQTVVALVCDESSPLAAAADWVLAVPEASEAAVAQTRSLAAELAFALLLRSRASGRSDGASELQSTFAALSDCHDGWAEDAAAIADGATGRVLVLGGNERWWLAREAVLKLTEMARVAAAAERTLEVPHGPIEGVTLADTIIVLGGGGGLTRREEAVVRRLREVVGRVVVVGVDAFRPPPGGGPSGRYASLPAQLHAVHLLALALAAARGVDADRPARITPYVTLDDEGEATEVESDEPEPAELGADGGAAAEPGADVGEPKR